MVLTFTLCKKSISKVNSFRPQYQTPIRDVHNSSSKQLIPVSDHNNQHTFSGRRLPSLGNALYRLEKPDYINLKLKINETQQWNQRVLSSIKKIEVISIIKLYYRNNNLSRKTLLGSIITMHIKRMNMIMRGRLLRI